MRRYVLALLVVLAALLASCSTVRLSYDQADWLLARMAGRYVDLTNSQARVFKARLAQFHVWHRNEQLPLYAEALDEAADRLARGLSRKDVEWAVEAVRARGSVLGEQAGAEFAPVLRTFSERQLAQMQREFDEDNDEFVDMHLSGNRVRLAARRETWLCDTLEDWVGPLVGAQRERVQKFVAAFPGTARLRLEERRRRQALFLEIVRDHRSSPQFDALLVGFLADPAAGRTEANRQATRHVEQGFVDMLVDLDRSLTQQQRRTAVANLRAYAADFRYLSREQVAAAD